MAHFLQSLPPEYGDYKFYRTVALHAKELLISFNMNRGFCLPSHILDPRPNTVKDTAQN